jgi:signal peptidase I
MSDEEKTSTGASRDDVNEEDASSSTAPAETGDTSSDPPSASSDPSTTAADPSTPAAETTDGASDGSTDAEATTVAPAAEAKDAAPTTTTKTVPKKIKVKKKRSLLARLTEIPILILLAFGIAILIKTFLVQAFFIPSGSMNPTLQQGDRVLVEKVGYAFGGPGRGDVVVFETTTFGGNKKKSLPWYEDARAFIRELLGLPTGNEEDYIKRVVAIGGDEISYSGKPRVMLINGEEVPQPFIKDGVDNSSPELTGSDCKRLDMDRSDNGDGCRVPAGMVFVMGDNRGNSEDSRVLGPVDEDKIVGRAILLIWPPSNFGTL